MAVLRDNFRYEASQKSSSACDGVEGLDRALSRILIWLVVLGS